MQPPSFWYPESDGAAPSLAARALQPLGWLYDLGGKVRRWRTVPARAGVPVICIGNLTAGGTGKTPLALTLAGDLRARGLAPAFLTRGYGGRLAGPVRVDTDRHSAEDVGDEPLILAHAGFPVIVSRGRPSGAQAAVREGADLILMDDGFQNPGLYKDVSLLVVDGEVAFGNGLVIPAGPLRESVEGGLARADAVIVMGERVSARTQQFLEHVTQPVFRARLEPCGPDLEALEGGRFLAFAGIGRPEKFFTTARARGLELAATRSFGDHHPFSAGDLSALEGQARDLGAALLTTEKDAMRLSPEWRARVMVLPVRAAIENGEALGDLVLQRVREAG